MSIQALKLTAPPSRGFETYRPTRAGGSLAWSFGGKTGGIPMDDAQQKFAYERYLDQRTKPDGVVRDDLPYSPNLDQIVEEVKRQFGTAFSHGEVYQAISHMARKPDLHQRGKHGDLKISRIQRNIGFSGRMFLDEAEWLTYCRRKPVRYIRTVKVAVCHVCRRPGSPENPLQNAHIVGFDVGVIDLGLTPEFLDSDKNIVTAHRRTCNKQSELDLTASMARLRELGVQELPKYLPSTIHQAWVRAAEPLYGLPSQERAP